MVVCNATWNAGPLLGDSGAPLPKRQKLDTKVEKEAKRVMQKHEDPRSAGGKAKAVYGARAWARLGLLRATRYWTPAGRSSVL